MNPLHTSCPLILSPSANHECDGLNVFFPFVRPLSLQNRSQVHSVRRHRQSDIENGRGEVKGRAFPVLRFCVRCWLRIYVPRRLLGRTHPVS